GRIRDANDAFLDMVGYTREEIASGSVSWRQMTPPELRQRDERALAEIEATGKCTSYEKEYISKQGTRVPVLLGAATFGRHEPGLREGVLFTVDLREQVRLRAVRDELLVKEQRARIDTELANTPA